jgi:ABC-type transport system involved in cytochrome c biogenesis permease subunit
MILDSAEGQIPELHQAKESWAALREAFLAGNNERFAEASETLINALQPLTPETAVSPDRIRTELFYNWLHPVRLSWIIMLIGCVFAFWSTVSDQKLARVLATAVLVAGFLMLTYGLYLRWQVAGRIPAANMYESLLFLGWGTGLFAIIAIPLLNDRVIPLTACMIGALSLLLADVLPLSPFVRPIPPVLRDTVWMTIHVPVIMVSYAVLSIAALVAHVQVVGLAIKPHDNKLAQRVDGLLYMYLLVGCFLLVIGICTGSMWASSSWGRYWGWDPKEVWSLIAFLGYLAILHVRADRGQPARWIQFVGWALASALILILTQRLEPLTVGKTLGLAGALVAGVVFLTTRGIFADALKSIIAFWMVIMTYVGVNFVLGMGLHSYGFGTGAVVKYLYLVGGIDLAILGVSSIAYLAARRATPAPAIEA